MPLSAISRSLSAIQNWFKPRQPTSFVEIPVPARGKLFVSPMPYGPYDVRNRVIRSYVTYRVSHVLMLVTDQEIEKKAKRDIFAEYDKRGIQVLRLPWPDLTAPVLDDITATLPRVVEVLRDGGYVAVHCNAGVGRTAVITACLVSILKQMSGEAAIEDIKKHMMVNLTGSQRRVILQWTGETADATPG